jgi:hypothetical protein
MPALARPPGVLAQPGYIITSSGANQVVGNKSFQQNSENHLQISFNVTCAPDVSDEQRSTMFANALQDRYALKKSNTSASLGVGVLGSVSMPIGSSDDSMVKVASETVTARSSMTAISPWWRVTCPSRRR